MEVELMKRIVVCLMAIGLLCFAAGAQANTFNFTGNISYHNDVVQFSFSLLNDATNVRVWTDSFQNGANFDPITALWTGTGNLIAENDDNATVNPATQTYWDSGFTLATLAAGNYLFTVAAYDNFASGTTLADGFRYDGQTPVPIEQWWVDAPGYYSVWFDGVDTATNPVPLPGAVWLLGSGLVGLLGFRRIKG
jgi:hypothetical protein